MGRRPATCERQVISNPAGGLVKTLHWWPATAHRTHARDLLGRGLEIAPLAERWTECAGGTVYSRTNAHPPRPDAADVTLVHGMVVSSRYMVPTAERLAPFCRVHAVDLPGYGKSYKPPGTLSLPELADALADWMSAMRMERAHLVGNSFGCQIIAEFAVRHPTRVQRLVLQGPTVDPRGRTLPRQLFRLFRNSFHESSELAGITRHDYQVAGWQRALQTLRIVLADRIEEKLPRIQAPALVVRGTMDPLVPRRWADEVVSLLTQGRLAEVEGAPHTMNFSMPDEFVRAILPFLGLADRLPHGRG
jgi:2-hydroxy-6-oxonona-2,4-dienedioate hydrolase